MARRSSGFIDYRAQAERLGIQNHREYINTQMAKACDAPDDALRSLHLANAIAANGLMLRSMDVGFITGELNYKAIREISEGIQGTRAFRSLMADGNGKRLAENGSIDAMVHDLQERDRELSEVELPTRPAIDVIRGVQAKVRARTAQPRDYATLVAAHQLSSWKGKTVAPDGKTVDVVRRDLNRQLDGKMLGKETDRVLEDPDFQYLMEHEKLETLYINTLRIHGIGFEKYKNRVEVLRQREAEQAKTAPEQAEAEPAAPQKKESSPEL